MVIGDALGILGDLLNDAVSRDVNINMHVLKETNLVDEMKMKYSRKSHLACV